MYLVTRTDLPLAQQIIQCAHAAEEVGQHLSPARPPDTSDFIALFGVPDETSLMALAEQLTAADVRYRLIREPDIGGAATALATEPLARGRRKRFPAHLATLWSPALLGSHSELLSPNIAPLRPHALVSASTSSAGGP